MESEEGKQRPSEVDLVFKQALREFKDNLVATYSVANRHGDTLNIKYKDLIGNFIHVTIFFFNFYYCNVIWADKIHQYFVLGNENCVQC